MKGKNKTMKKKKIHNDVEVETTNCYQFYNTVTKVMLFVDAFTFEEAMNKFDLSIHKHREDWRIFVECSLEPA